MDIFAEVAITKNNCYAMNLRLQDVLMKTLTNIEHERIGLEAPYNDEEIHSEAEGIRAEMLQNTEKLSDEAAVYVVELFPEWKGTETYTKGQRIFYKGYLYLVEQDVITPIENWTPDITYDYYTPIPKAGEKGEQDNPITAVAGMKYISGLYYSENEKLYLCKRNGLSDGEEIKLHYLPSALIGQYFEEASLYA